MSRSTVITRQFNDLVRINHTWTPNNHQLDELHSLFNEMSKSQQISNLPVLNLIELSLGYPKTKFERSHRGAAPTINRHLYAD